MTIPTKRAFVVALLLICLGCSSDDRFTKETLAKLYWGQDFNEVQDILGKPTMVRTGLGNGSTLEVEWRKGTGGLLDPFIFIVFVNGRAVMMTYNIPGAP